MRTARLDIDTCVASSEFMEHCLFCSRHHQPPYGLTAFHTQVCRTNRLHFETGQLHCAVNISALMIVSPMRADPVTSIASATLFHRKHQIPARLQRSESCSENVLKRAEIDQR